jgi:hypothetical protein
MEFSRISQSNLLANKELTKEIHASFNQACDSQSRKLDSSDIEGFIATVYGQLGLDLKKIDREEWQRLTCQLGHRDSETVTKKVVGVLKARLDSEILETPIDGEFIMGLDNYQETPIDQKFLAFLDKYKIR